MLNLDTAEIQEAVVARIADEIMGDWDWKQDARRKIEERIDAAFADGLQKLVDETVEKAVAAGFDHEYHRLDNFGRSNGQTTTIRKELDRLISEYWTTRVDRSGKPTESAYNSTSRAEWMMVQMCGKGFSEQIKPDVIAVTAALKDGLRDRLRAEVDQVMGGLFHVKTKTDKAEGRSV